MKRFFLIIIISFSCGEAVDIEATIDARALRISMDNINNMKHLEELHLNFKKNDIGIGAVK